jgi:hypothetical protein
MQGASPLELISVTYPAVPCSFRHKVQLVGADAYLVPQRSEFYSLFSGAEAWRTAEVAELQRLIQVGGWAQRQLG